MTQPRNEKIGRVTTDQVVGLIDDPGITIIDSRPVDLYNGWIEPGSSRGGHIPGARSLPVKWTDYIDWIEIVRNKGVSTDNRVVVYGNDRDDTIKVADRFVKAGYNFVSAYHEFVSEWLADESMPVKKLTRYRNLVSAKWVHSLISGEKPAEYDGNSFVVVHAHYRNRDAYLTGHIPGAVDMDTLALEAPETWNRRSPAELEDALLKHGITADTTVILYGKYMSPDNRDPFPGSAAGDIGAIRCALIMMYAGVRDIRVLNGGFQSWIDAGYETSTADMPARKIAAPFGSVIPAKPELFVDTPEAKVMIASDDAELVCVRSLPEYRGETSGYNYIEPRGRIPGALFADCGSDAYHMENYRNLDHTTREFGETEKVWVDSGITPDKHLAFYCGTGWRGSEAWFNAWLMGWPKVSVYDGGWFEWSSDPLNPFERDM